MNSFAYIILLGYHSRGGSKDSRDFCLLSLSWYPSFPQELTAQPFSMCEDYIRPNYLKRLSSPSASSCACASDNPMKDKEVRRVCVCVCVCVWWWWGGGGGLQTLLLIEFARW